MRLATRTLRAAGMAVAVAVAMAGCPTATSANPVRSLYSTIDLKQCKKSGQHPDGGAWTCEGLEGWPVYVGEGDLRQFLAFGPRPEKRKSASQTRGAFNTIFKGKTTRATVEWRFDRDVQPGSKANPIAAIVRHFTSRDGKRGELLVIYKVTQADSCEIGIIDALANKDANALARSAADEYAKTADCNAPPRTFGQQGKGPQ